MKKGTKNFLKEESGAVAPFVAAAIIVLLSCAALSVDMGHLVWVKSDLQKAADAGALAGVRALATEGGTPVNPNWIQGTTVAQQTALENRADGQLVTGCDVEYGYWDLAKPPPQSPLDPVGTIPTTTQVPAVRVTVTKAAGENGGPVQMLFATIFKKNTADVSAQAVAIISGIIGVPAGGAFPIATPKKLVDDYWGTDKSFKIGSSYHTDDGLGGQWTSFDLDVNNVPAIENLIDNGSPVNLNVGDPIWIEPGTKDTLFAYAESKVGSIVLLPVVQDILTHAEVPLLGFVPFYIEAAVGGSGKYIQGHFVDSYNYTGGTPGHADDWWGTFVIKVVN